MASFKAYSEIPFSCPFCWLCCRQGWARYPPHPGSIHPEVLSQPPLPRIYLSLFPHLKETVPRNEVGQQEERARCVPEDLRGGRELGSGARASCLHRDAQTACGTAYWIPWSEVGRIYVSHQFPGIQNPPGSPFRNIVLYETTEGLQERKGHFSHDL